MKPKWGGISKYMGLDKLLKTLGFYLLSYTCIYIRRFLLFQPQHTIKVFFSSMCCAWKPTGMIFSWSKFKKFEYSIASICHEPRQSLY